MTTSNLKWIIGSLFLAPILTFAFFIIAKAENIPYGDDTALFLTVNELNSSISRILTTLFEQHNEHRILFSRLAMLFVYQLTDYINFRYVILLGFFNIVLLAYTFYLLFITTGSKIPYFLPVIILLFSPIIHTNQVWAITSFEYILAINFSLLTLYFLQPKLKSRWYFSFVFAIAASLSNLDGICVLPVALVWLILQKRRKESWYFGIFMVLYLYLFFLNFSLSKSISTPPFPELISILIKGTLSFIGGISKVMSDSLAPHLSVVFGGIMTLIFLWLIFQNAWSNRTNRKVLFPLDITDISLLNLFACGLMIAYGRANASTPSLVADRFQIYAVTIGILFYLVLLNHLKNVNIRKIVLVFSVCSAILLNLLSYMKYDRKMDYHNDKLLVDAYNYTHHEVFLHQFHNVMDPPPFNYRNYRFPISFTEEEIKNWENQVINDTAMLEKSFVLQTVETAPDMEDSIFPILNVEVSNLPDSLSNKRLYLAFFLESGNKAPFLTAIPVNQAGWLQTHMIKEKTQPTRASLYFTNKLPTDNYNVALCWRAAKKLYSLTLTKSFKIENAGIQLGNQ